MSHSTQQQKEPQTYLDRGLSYLDGVILLCETTLRNERKSKLKAELEEVKKKYSSKERPATKEQLYGLMKYLQEFLVRFGLSTHNKDAYKKMIEWEALAVSQNTASRYQLLRTEQARNKDVEHTLQRQEFMCIYLTPVQTAVWQKILTASPPTWFNALDPTIQAFYRKKVNDYQSQKEDPKRNLGEFIGFQTSTVRKTPGSANLWAQKTTDSNNKVTYKIRSAYVVPFDMLQDRVAQEEILQVTVENIKQQIAFSLYLKIMEKIENGEQDPSIKDFSFLLQNLISLPLQPEGVSASATEILSAALKEVQAYLAISEKRAALFEAAKQFQQVDLGGLDQTKKTAAVTALERSKNAMVQILFSHHPVNSARGLSTIAMFFQPWKRQETKKMYQAIDSLNAGDDRKIQAAIRKHRSNRRRWTLPGWHKWNPNAEQAALEQIIMQHKSEGKDFFRAGSCVSGKDREEMVGILKLAMEEIYKETEKFPPAPGDKDSEKIRERFELKVAALFIKQYGPMIADMNAPGSDGLKNIKDVYGSRVCERINELAETNDLGGKFWQRLEKRAKLNKIKSKKIDGDKKTRGCIEREKAALEKAAQPESPVQTSSSSTSGVEEQIAHFQAYLPVDPHAKPRAAVNGIESTRKEQEHHNLK